MADRLQPTSYGGANAENIGITAPDNVGYGPAQQLGATVEKYRQPNTRSVVDVGQRAGDKFPEVTGGGDDGEDARVRAGIQGAYHVPIPKDPMDTTMSILKAARNNDDLEKLLPGTANTDLRATITSMADNTSPYKLNTDVNWLSEYVERKQKENDQLDLWNFAMTLMNQGTNPALRDKVQKAFPEIVKMQRDVLNYCYDVEKRLHEINLTGVQTRDDFVFLWMYNNGYFKTAQQYMKDAGINMFAPTSAPAYTTGMFNPYPQSVTQARSDMQGLAPVDATGSFTSPIISDFDYRKLGFASIPAQTPGVQGLL